MSFMKKQLRITFTLGEGAFGESGSNTTVLQGLRASAKISKVGGFAMSTLSLAVYGMSLSEMNALSTLGFVMILTKRNTVTVEAGDENGTSIVFIGTIRSAWFDGNSQPDVAFRVEAQTGLIEALKDAPPSSYKGQADVSDVMKNLAGQMNLDFENNGVSFQLSNPYYSGSARNQSAQAANDAAIQWIIDNGKLAIWPKDGHRNGPIPVIAPGQGLVGYPGFTGQGINIRAEFIPSVLFGGQIQIQNSQLTGPAGQAAGGQGANGTWTVFGLDYELESQVPHGKWFMEINATQPGLTPGAGSSLPIAS